MPLLKRPFAPLRTTIVLTGPSNLKKTKKRKTAITIIMKMKKEEWLWM